MSLSKGVGSAIAGIAGIVVLVVVVVILMNVLSSEPPVDELIVKSIDLRNAESPVDRADLITEIDDLVAAAKDEDVREQWERMLDCLRTSCPDEAYLDMTLVTVSSFENEVERSALLINVIATAKYWGREDQMLDFSKALSTANDQVEELGDRSVEKSWDAVVECNGECPEMFDLYFDLVKNVVQ